MPNQPATPARAVRVSDELWEAARAEAARQDVTISDVVRDALARYLSARSRTKASR